MPLDLKNLENQRNILVLVVETQFGFIIVIQSNFIRVFQWKDKEFLIIIFQNVKDTLLLL